MLSLATSTTYAQVATYGGFARCNGIKQCTRMALDAYRASARTYGGLVRCRRYTMFTTGALGTLGVFGNSKNDATLKTCQLRVGNYYTTTRLIRSRLSLGLIGVIQDDLLGRRRTIRQGAIDLYRLNTICTSAMYRLV